MTLGDLLVKTSTETLRKDESKSHRAPSCCLTCGGKSDWLTTLDFRCHKRFLALPPTSRQPIERKLHFITVTSKTGVDLSQEWGTQIDSSLRAGLLTAIAANTAIIVVSGWPGLVPSVPINSLRLDRTQYNTSSATGAFSLVDDRPLG